MHYMHSKDYIHHGLAAEKTTPPLPQGGGEPSGWVGGGCGGPCSYIHIFTYVYIYICVCYNVWVQSVWGIAAPRMITQQLGDPEAVTTRWW